MAERSDSWRGDGRVEETSALHEEIADTRARMSETIDEIGDRLNVNRIKGQLRESVREQVHETKERIRAATIGKAQNMARNAVDSVNDKGHSLMSTIRGNPVPAAMIGVGLGWLLLKGRRGSGREIHSTYHMHGGVNDWSEAGGEEHSAMDRVKERASDVGHRVKETASDVGHNVKETASEVADRAQHAASAAAHRTQDVASHLMHDHPVVLGAAALAIGLAAGMSMPATRREDELMGPARDRMMDRAQRVASEKASQLSRVAERVLEETGQVARSAANDIRDTAREAARDEGLVGENGGGFRADGDARDDETARTFEGGFSASGGDGRTQPADTDLR